MTMTTQKEWHIQKVNMRVGLRLWHLQLRVMQYCLVLTVVFVVKIMN